MSRDRATPQPRPVAPGAAALKLDGELPAEPHAALTSISSNILSIEIFLRFCRLGQRRENGLGARRKRRRAAVAARAPTSADIWSPAEIGSILCHIVAQNRVPVDRGPEAGCVVLSAT